MQSGISTNVSQDRTPHLLPLSLQHEVKKKKKNCRRIRITSVPALSKEEVSAQVKPCLKTLSLLTPLLHARRCADHFKALHSPFIGSKNLNDWP